MKNIERLSDQIKEELEDACSYIDEALDLKERDPDTATLYYQLSIEEMTHVDKLHNRVVALIQEYRKANGDPPPEMQWRYDYLHGEHVSKANKIKVKQLLFKN